MRWESKFEKWPGFIELPDVDDFMPVHWRDWREALKAVTETEGEDQRRALYQSFAVAGAAWIVKHGTWAIDGISAESMTTLEGADGVPVKFQAWLNKQLERYFADLLNPKG